jgi:alkanesulfonate monooxygenase SsuD/methylene tetrahydromethanopterin reductase-like flavin-dependent oxidoreductase (luciferase family)
VKLGVITVQNAPWPELVERWQRLDEMGIETIWVADHLWGEWLDPGEPWFECWSCLAAMTQMTAHARIGSLVSPMSFRNPAVLARQALSVAEMSGGRLELGVGSGAYNADNEIAEVPAWTPRQRAVEFARWIERLVELLADERLYPKSPIPLTIAGRGPTILRATARFADRWNTFGGHGLSAEEALGDAREDMARLDEHCAETGRTVLRSVLIGYPFIAEMPWRSIDAFAEVVGRWEDAGFDEIVFYYPPETMMPPGSVTPGVFEAAYGAKG